MATPAKPFLLYDNRFNDAVPTATDVDPAVEFSVLNILDWREYTWWQGLSVGTKYITINCGGAKSADTLAIAGHNFFTAEATISLESSINGTDWTSRITGFTVLSNDVLVKTFTSASAQHWRLKIVTASIVAKMAVLTLGVRMDFEHGFNRDFDPDAQGIEADTKRSVMGYPLGTTIRFYPRSINWQFRGLTPAWCANTFYPVWVDHLSLMKPCFIAPDITNLPLAVYLVQLKDGEKLSMPYTGMLRSLNLNFVGLRE